MYRGGASVADGWADRLSAAPFVINTLTCLLIKFKWVQQAEGGIGRGLRVRAGASGGCRVLYDRWEWVLHEGMNR